MGIKTRIGWKLIIAFFFFTVIPMVFVFIYTNNTVTEQIIANTNFSNEKSFIQANEILSYRIEDIYKTIITTITNSEFINIINKPRRVEDINENIKDMEKLNQILSFIRENDDILNYSLYLKPEDPISEYYNIYNNVSFSIDGRGKHLDNIFSEVPWISGKTAAGNSFISIIHYIYNQDDYESIIGVLLANINTDVLTEILRNAINTRGTEIFLLNSHGEIIISSSGSIIWPHQSNIGDIMHRAAGSGTVSLNNRETFIYFRKTEKTSWHKPAWTLLSITSMEDMRDPINYIMHSISNVALFSVIVFFIFSIFFTTSITRRLNIPVIEMRKIQNGNFNGIIIPRGSDEITELMADFNYMIKRINMLVSENAKQLNDSWENELLALQSQINSHFLYNSLDLINWIAIKYRIGEIQEIIQSLSRFYKLCLDDRGSIIPLSDEIAHLRSYLDIQYRRFKNAIKWKIDIPEKFFCYSVIKLTLQPIVENSIRHGILKKPSKKGSFTLTAADEDDSFIITVRDDGIGIEKDKLNKFVNKNFERQSGYGLYNIHERIQLNFGKEFGLGVQSKKGEYTEVFIKFPKIIYQDGS
jgi:two-component system sensor histidine kinase YesM